MLSTNDARMIGYPYVKTTMKKPECKPYTFHKNELKMNHKLKYKT